MDFSISGEQQKFCESIEQIVSSNFLDVLEEFCPQRWRQCGQEGLLGLSVPSTLGGRGLDQLSLILALETLGRSCPDNGLTFAIGAQLLAGLMPILHYGTAEQKETFLPALCRGETVLAHALTEEHSGSDVFAMSSVATDEGDHFRLRGSKCYCSLAPVADWVLIYAVTDDTKCSIGAVSLFLVPASQLSKGEALPKLGLHACPMGSIEFDTLVPRESLLGKLGTGAFAFSQIMTWERIGLSAIHIGIIERLLKSVAHHCRNRQLSGTPLSKFQAVSHPLAEIKSQLEAARWMTRHAAWLLSQGKRGRAEASRVKLFVSELYKRSTQTILQIYGAKGYAAAHPIQRELRDSLAATLYSGTSEVQKNLIAAEFL